MTDFNTYRFGFIGLGLIGGSIARAIRLYWPEAVITAYNPSPDTLAEALADGVVNTGRSGADGPLDGSQFEDCDIIFLCAPVQKNAENLAAVSGHLKASAILTDIGSTKRDILDHVEAAGLSRYFIGGHPMTGSERMRYHNSEAGLLVNAYYIVSPSKKTPLGKTAIMQEFVSGIRAIPLLIDCDFHDYAVAGISHLPHIVACSLVKTVQGADSENGIMHTLAAGGFRDTTRIAASSPDMWEQICMTNGENIVQLIDRYIDVLQQTKADISARAGSELHEFFADVKEYRDSFTAFTSGAKDILHMFYIDIEDRPGTLAEVVTLLAINTVSIKNIGITHNREFQKGSLRIEFYSDADMQEAMEILQTRNYTIYTSRI